MSSISEQEGTGELLKEWRETLPDSYEVASETGDLL